MTSIKTAMGSTMTKSRARSTEFMFIFVVIIKKVFIKSSNITAESTMNFLIIMIIMFNMKIMALATEVSP